MNILSTSLQDSESNGFKTYFAHQNELVKCICVNSYSDSPKSGSQNRVNSPIKRYKYTQCQGWIHSFTSKKKLSNSLTVQDLNSNLLTSENPHSKASTLQNPEVGKAQLETQSATSANSANAEALSKCFSVNSAILCIEFNFLPFRSQ